MELLKLTELWAIAVRAEINTNKIIANELGF